MSTRCIIRNLFLFALSLAVVAWPSISKATVTAEVLNWTSAEPGLFIPSLQYPVLTGTPTAAQLTAFPGAMSWNAGAAAASFSPGAFAPSGLTYTGGLNMTNNDLIIQADNPTDALAAYTNLNNATTVGYNGGAWTGSGGGGPSNSTGIYSDSTAINPSAPSGATDPDFLTGIGVVLNDGATNNVFGQDTTYTSFDGDMVGANSVLVKFTYYGDTDLRGFVDNNDIGNAETGRDFDLSGWANGETLYRGFVDNSDIGNIETSRDFYASDPIVGSSSPSVSMFESGAFAVSPVSVPEPATGAMALLGVLGLLVGSSARRRVAAKKLVGEWVDCC